MKANSRHRDDGSQSLDVRSIVPLRSLQPAPTLFDLVELLNEPTSRVPADSQPSLLRGDGLVRQERPQLIRAGVDVAIVLRSKEESDTMIGACSHDLETIRLAVTHMNHPSARWRRCYRDDSLRPHIRLLRTSQPLGTRLGLGHLDPLGPLLVKYAQNLSARRDRQNRMLQETSAVTIADRTQATHFLATGKVQLRSVLKTKNDRVLAIPVTGLATVGVLESRRDRPAGYSENGTHL